MRPGLGSTLGEWLEYQESIHPQDIELGLERLRPVAARLQLGSGRIKTITIAGTNGKGSSASLCAEAYRQAGFKVGLYTSPHLLSYNERIGINGQCVSDRDLVRAFAAVEAARETVRLTYFEFGTLAALYLFQQSNLEVQVLEVGLGGRLDAVNIVNADAALLTSIGLDHTDWLGADRESIASEKVGVFRMGRAAICADPQPPMAVSQYADQVGAKLFQLGQHFDLEREPSGWRWKNATQSIELPLPRVPGDAQLRNAAGVVALIQALSDELPVSNANIGAALESSVPPGRIQFRDRQILDVAHNVEAVEELLEVLKHRIPSSRIVLVIGMLRAKPVAGVAERFARRVAHAYCASLPEPRGLSSAQLAVFFRAVGTPVSCFSDPLLACQAAMRESDPTTKILVTGSFLTVSAVIENG